MTHLHAIVFLLAFCVAQHSADAQERLELRFEPGLRFTLKCSSSVKQTVTADGRSFDYEARLENVRAVRALDRNEEGVVRLELTFTDYQLFIVQPGGEIPAKDAFKHYLGAKVILKVKPNGQVVEIEGFDGYLKRIRGEAKGVAALFASFVRPESQRQELEQLFAFLPPGPAKPGEEWTKDAVVPAIDTSDLKAKFKYVLKDEEEREGRRLRRIDLNVDLQQQGTKTAENPHLVQSKAIAYRYERMAGQVWFDAKLGRPVAAELEAAAKSAQEGKTQARDFTTKILLKQKVSYAYADGQSKP